MPFAVAHILIPIILIGIVRDFYLKKKTKKKFSLHYVLISGIGGILPDMDIAAFWVLYFFGFTFEQVHKTFLHSIFIPLIFFILFMIFLLVKEKKRKLKFSVVFLMLGVGVFTHLILDMIFGEPFSLFYPISDLSVGIGIVGYLPLELQWMAMPSLDAALIIIWVIYLEARHKISDFI